MLFSGSTIKAPTLSESRWMLLTQVALCSLLIALCAQIRIALPFTPVPITFQTLAVLIVGGMLGSRNGALCVVLYLAEALLGLPVLSGGRSDPFFLLSPVGGYLVGYVIQAYLAGWFVERRKVLGRPVMYLGLGLACTIQMSCGAYWLAFFVGARHVWALGIAPFIVGELFKIALAGMFFKRYVRHC
ncbi:MAG: biotin transporter BioY [Parachlamydiaceae bacterium]|nr:biotin transporter BioY [Parachlamydiaceae bacterium]